MVSKQASRAGAAGPARQIAVAVFATAAVALGACGGGDDRGDMDGGPAPTLQASAFPRPASRSLRALVNAMPQGPELVPSAGALGTGSNRFEFGLFDRGNRQIADLKVALYTARGLDETAHGPTAARFQRTAPASGSETNQPGTGPQATKPLYVADLRLTEPGGYTIVAVASLGGRWVASPPTQVTVSRPSR
jgi:hypothetical protein